MFLHKTNPKVEDYGYGLVIPHLKKISELIKNHHRVTFHPGQFNVLGTPHKRTLEMTIKDLDYHATVLDILETGKDSCHGNTWWRCLWRKKKDD